MAGRAGRQLWSSDALTLFVIAIGGMGGAAARHAVTLALPAGRDSVPWSTVVVNLSGCLLIGALMVLVLETRRLPRLARPFLGVGVLGGYTTFSAYALDTQRLLLEGRPATALAYLLGTLVAALLAVQLGAVLARAAVRPRPARWGRP